ncbi:MAG: sarcosine oxidase subunit delta [Steroidobacteraceae bacterium]
MLQIPCVCCGLRDENEFVCGGTAHLQRPPLEADDTVWAEYLFFRDNPKGLHPERWRHVHGCGLWFNLIRDTVTHDVRCAYPITGRPPP